MVAKSKNKIHNLNFQCGSQYKTHNVTRMNVKFTECSEYNTQNQELIYCQWVYDPNPKFTI